MARRFLAAALPNVGETADADLRDALARLAAWDGDMAEDSVAATLHFGWLVHFTRAAIAQAIGPERAATLLAKGEQTGFPFMPFYEIAYELALRWLERLDWPAANRRRGWATRGRCCCPRCAGRWTCCAGTSGLIPPAGRGGGSIACPSSTR
jgi:acyl-homoserine lactone acylase PvdQ